jgi:hypothetical protein
MAARKAATSERAYAVAVHTPTALLQSGAPWWGVPVLGALFTILGIAISHYFTSRNERSRATQEDKTFRRNQLISACAGFHANASATYLRVRKNTDREVHNDMSALLHAYAVIQITAPRSIVISAEQVRDAVFSSQGIDAKREWQVMQGTGYLHAMENFTRVVRGELDVEEEWPVIRTEVIKVTHIIGIDDDDGEEFVIDDPNPNLTITYESD